MKTAAGLSARDRLNAGIVLAFGERRDHNREFLGLMHRKVSSEKVWAGMEAPARKGNV